MAVMSSGDDIKRRTSRIPAPQCPVHGAKMLVYSLNGRVRYCKCPVAGCTHTGKALGPAVEAEHERN